MLQAQIQNASKHCVMFSLPIGPLGSLKLSLYFFGLTVLFFVTKMLNNAVVDQAKVEDPAISGFCALQLLYGDKKVKRCSSFEPCHEETSILPM